MDNRATLEVIAPTIEEAIAKGISELGLPEEAVEIEVLDPGSKGLFGIGSRQARVRLIVKSSEQKVSTVSAIEDKSTPPEIPAAAEHAETVVKGQEAGSAAAAPAPISKGNLVDEIALQVAHDTVQELLEKMKVKASINVYYGEPDEAQSKAPLCVDISGKDLSILIGRQAETLNALQYITSLIVGKEIGHSIPMIVDVESYRKRRQQQIRYLARRMADQAVKTGKRQILEPMPANERRIVHIELRDNPDVVTESTGEEPRRKVTIIPKQ